ncbi:methylated-DNA--[protein]-cysteine S-methyltransferase [Paenibacillus protaetiae]|uniref:methylated-DNA--[protein]-cysteine S-methyltransferase n=1 Tax=Paenibacillus protaetiae TaxID=2509456 RepID=A0A4P6EW97_9BACL|nr:methylated-DNA--[protein]-cysteine S-methyltransferase [Paenibacillus protaetiae]QAY67620.1 methylated-DNA--[protein]-cysteine S-methyltransferase [Paenibacillus protaetiae]
MKQNKPEQIVWGWFEHGDWTMVVAATGKGICYVGSPGAGLRELEAWAAKRMPEGMLVHDEERLKEAKAQLRRYLQGESAEWECAMDLRGTAFQLEVWRALQEVGAGTTETYSALAGKLGRPSAVRAVASAIGANPVLIAVPCHRIIGKDGTLTGYRGGLPMKERLLRLEAGRR